MTTVLHVAPHPDDESIGAPCTLLRLAETGARVVVVACGLGRPAHHERRRRELAAACASGGLEMLVRRPPVALGSRDDLPAAERLLTPWISGLIDELRADLVIGPHLHDAHPAHEAVARAVREAIRGSSRPPVWWSHAIWNDLRHPTLVVPHGPEVVERAITMLSCHRGEVARNDYVDMVRAAGRLAAIRGVERVLGFGSHALPDARHAELLTEVGRIGGRWRFGLPRVATAPDLPAGWGADATHLVDGGPSASP